MSSYVSILSCISNDEANDNNKESDDKKEELSENDSKEISEIVEDLMTIQNKDVLKRNLINLVTENVALKAKNKQLESDLESRKQNQDISFQIDCDGGDNDIEAVPILGVDSVPILGQEVPPASPTVASKSKGGCFNCGESNCSVGTCPHPKDPKKIAKNRREFQAANIGLNSARYHEDEPQKFGHLSPGLPSSKLSEALGLRKDELPRYIYMMRDLGYPPGWMKHAEIGQSGMSLYHAKGEKLDLDEDGEVVDVGDKTEYDISKLVAWPGFNTELPGHARDDTSRYRVRRRSRVQTLDQMRNNLKHKEQKGYVRKEMQDLSTKVSDEDDDAPPGDDADDGPPGDDDEDGEVRAVTPTTPVQSKSQFSNTVTQVDPGTPICEMFSPFSRLPRYDNFGKDMTEHIAFENLPNYTGNWDKMRGVLKGVRDKKTDKDAMDQTE